MHKLNKSVASSRQSLDCPPWQCTIALLLLTLTVGINALRIIFDFGYNYGVFNYSTMNHRSCCIGFLESYLLPITIGLLLATIGLWLKTTKSLVFSMIMLITVELIYFFWYLNTQAIISKNFIQDFAHLADQRQYLLPLYDATWWDLTVLLSVTSLFIWQSILLSRMIRLRGTRRSAFGTAGREARVVIMALNNHLGKVGFCLLGAVDGLVIGIAAELVRGRYAEYEIERTAIEYSLQPSALHFQMADVQPWFTLPMQLVVMFTCASYIVHSLSKQRRAHSILIWEGIAVLAMLMYFAISLLLGPYNSAYVTEVIKHSFIYFALAGLSNLIYAAVVKRIYKTNQLRAT